MINSPYSSPRTSASQQKIFQMYNPISKLGDRAITVDIRSLVTSTQKVDIFIKYSELNCHQFV